jgi:endonuclease/exonuclease/phosphatase family metal-dependent hydrolase
MVQLRRDLFRLIEAALIGLFFVQAVRFLYGTLYAHLSSASLVLLTTNAAALVNEPGVVDVLDVQNELIITGVMLALPLLSVIFGRLWFGPALVAIVAAVGRVFMTANGGTPLGVAGAAITAGTALLYLACIAVRRPSMMPIMLIFGVAGDQIIRLIGNTADFTWEAAFLTEATIASLVLFLAAVLAAVFDRLTPPTKDEPKGEIAGWNAFALGGLLYLQFAVFGLPNTLGHRVQVAYLPVAPLLIVATLLPLVPEVRNVARQFLAMFDSQYRGWIWFLIMCLLMVVGFRLTGMVAASALVVAQFVLCLTWWWVIQPAAGRFNFTAIGVWFGVMVFLALTGGDFLTFEYAFVRGVQEPFGSLLRAFRGLGIAIVLFALLLGCLPAILARKRLPWTPLLRRTGAFVVTASALGVVVMAGVLAYVLAQPTVLVAATPTTQMQIRVATLNLHGGYSLYYGVDLPRVASELQKSGAEIVLLQEVDGGRMVSFGIDQAAWLARNLDMQVAYFPTNESLQGLAVLSKLPIVRAEGVPLTSRSKQTGAQFVQVRTPDGQLLDLYNTQLSLLFRTGTLSIEDQSQDQDQQIGEIIAYIERNRSTAGRMILGGTFNHTPGTKIYEFLRQRRFTDAFENYPAERGVTLRLVNNPPVRVDYLWLYCAEVKTPTCLTPAGLNVVPLLASSHNIAVVAVQLGSPS